MPATWAKTGGSIASCALETTVENRSGLAVLVVEDEPLISMMVAEMVTELGHTIVAELRTSAEA